MSVERFGSSSLYSGLHVKREAFGGSLTIYSAYIGGKDEHDDPLYSNSAWDSVQLFSCLIFLDDAACFRLATKACKARRQPRLVCTASLQTWE